MSEDQIIEIKYNLCINCGDRYCCHGMESCKDANKYIVKGSGEKMKYITYEEPLKGKTFTEKQMHEVYRDLADKAEYPDFECWKTDIGCYCIVDEDSLID